MASSNAWLLPLGDRLNIAVGEYEIMHLVHFPALFAVPGTPFYCNQVLVWQNQILPVMDLAAWVQGQSHKREQKLIAIAAYTEPGSDATQHAGLLLEDVPRKVIVDDGTACDLPNEPNTDAWKRIAISCFKYTEHAVPIIDLQTVFSDALIH